MTTVGSISGPTRADSVQHVFLADTEGQDASDMRPSLESASPEANPSREAEAIPQLHRVGGRRRRLLKSGAAALEQGAPTVEEMRVPSVRVEKPQLRSPVLLVTAQLQPAVELTRWVGQNGYAAVIARTLVEAVEHVHSCRSSCMIVDLDSFNDLNSTVDTLITLRQHRPNLAVILMTMEVKRDDFSLERLPMCDVTLRYPVASEDIDFALQEAKINNQVWVMRCRKVKLLEVV